MPFSVGKAACLQMWLHPHLSNSLQSHTFPTPRSPTPIQLPAVPHLSNSLQSHTYPTPCSPTPIQIPAVPHLSNSLQSHTYPTPFSPTTIIQLLQSHTYPTPCSPIPIIQLLQSHTYHPTPCSPTPIIQLPAVPHLSSNSLQSHTYPTPCSPTPIIQLPAVPHLSNSMNVCAWHPSAPHLDCSSHIIWQLVIVGDYKGIFGLCAVWGLFLMLGCFCVDCLTPQVLVTTALVPVVNILWILLCIHSQTKSGTWLQAVN